MENTYRVRNSESYTAVCERYFRYFREHFPGFAEGEWRIRISPFETRIKTSLAALPPSPVAVELRAKLDRGFTFLLMPPGTSIPAGRCDETQFFIVMPMLPSLCQRTAQKYLGELTFRGRNRRLSPPRSSLVVLSDAFNGWPLGSVDVHPSLKQEFLGGRAYVASQGPVVVPKDARFSLFASFASGPILVQRQMPVFQIYEIGWHFEEPERNSFGEWVPMY